MTLASAIDVFVDLPSHQKGSHLSRNLEVINSILDRNVREPQESVERLAVSLSREILEKHEYAGRSEVMITADYFLERAREGYRTSLENYRIFGRSRVSRDGRAVKSLGVEVLGMNACPCAMEAVRETLSGKYPESGSLIKELPVATHNQRNRVTVHIESEESAPEVEADDLIDIVEESQSAPTHEILKRSQEGALVVKAFKNPKFVEDIVREVLGRILERYPGLPGDTVITVRSESEESIHKHNAFAERVASVGELRE